MKIGHEAFYGCGGLTSVTIPGTVVWIGAGAFAECWNLTRVVIPPSVTEIEEYVFEGCDPAKLVLVVKKDSYAHQYALRNQIPVVLQ